MDNQTPRSALGNKALNDVRGLTFYDLPLTLSTTVRISGPFPLTAEEFERLELLLAVMKPGLIRDPKEGEA